jgi:hypothetical protein
MIARQQKQIEALTVGLQKVSAQLAAASPSRGGLEASKFRHRTNPPWWTCTAGGKVKLLTISAKPDGVEPASQPLILRDERSGLQTRIATTESVSLCVRMNC